MPMKTRKIMAFLVSASMSFNVLASSAVDIVSADELDDVTLQEVPESLEETDTVDNETEIEEEVISDIDDTEIIEEEIEGIPEEISDAIDAAPFSEETEVDGVIISVSADEGVFPEGAYMNVERVEDTEDSDALIEETLDDDVNIAHSMTFDITIFDSEGNEIEPDTEAGNVYVSFTDSLVADSNLDVDVYHITDEDEAIALDVNVEDELVVAETDGFSYYTLVFSYESLTYEMDGDTTVPLTTILDTIGLSGTVSSVTSSQTALVTATETNGVWYVTAIRTFNNPITLTVQIGSTDYTIDISPNNTYSQVEENDYMGYRVAQVTNSGVLTFPGMNIYGFSGSDHSASGRVNTTCYARGYRSVMRVGDESEVYFDNFAYGKPYYSDGVESYITAEIQGQAVYLTYHITNNNTTDSQVRIASYGDCNIGHDDHAILTPNGNGLSMVSANAADNGARFFLMPSGVPFDTIWVGCTQGGGVTEDYMRTHMFDNSIAVNDGTKDSAVAWSWSIDVPAGATVTRVAILAVTPDVATKTVTLNLNDGSGSTESVITIGDMGLILPVNEEERDGYEFSGWSTDPDSTVPEYADGATVPIDEITDGFQLYGVWTPEGAQISDSQRPTAVDAVFDPNGVALANGPQDSLDGYTVMYRLDENDPWSSTIPEADHVDDYTVYYMFDGDPDLPGGSFTSHVTAATPTASQKPTANDGAYVEGGRPLVRAPESSISGVTVEYRTEGTTWSSDIPKGGYGSHTVYYRYVDNDGNENYAGGTIDVEVSQAAAPTSLTDDQKPTVNNLVYTGGNQPLVTSPAATDYPDGYDTLLYKNENGEWVTDIPTGNNAGDYIVEFRYEDSTGNHAPIEGTIEDINIGQASGLGTVTDEQRPHAVDGTVTYDGTAQTLVTDEGMTSYPAGYNDVMYRIGGTGDWSYDLPSEINAGDYMISVKYIPADINHVEFIDSVTIPVSIEKAPVTITVNADQGMRYGETEPALEASVDYKPASGADVIYSISRAAGTDVGTYAITVIATEEDNPNYEITVNNNATFTISQATAPSADSLDPEQKPTAVNTTFDPNGVALANGPTEALPYYTVEYSLNGTDWSEEIPTADHVDDYEVYYRYNGDANHADAEGGSFTSHVTAATPTASQKPTANNTTFVDQDVPLVNNPTTPVQGATVQYSTNGTDWSSTPPTGGAGRYEVQYRYVDADGNENYAGGTISVEVSQAPAPSLTDAQKPTVNSLHYTGNDQELVTSPAATDYPQGYDTLFYKDENGAWVSAIPTGDDATDYTVEFRYEDSTGNRAPIEGTVPVTIAPAAAPNASDVNDNEKPTPISGLAYTGSAQALVTAPSSLPDGYDQVWYRTDDGNEWSQTIPTGVNATEYEISVKYVDSFGNHEDLTGVTVTGKINPAASAFAFLTENNKPHAASGLYYTSNPQVLVVGPSEMPANYETIEYSVDGGNTWVTEPTGTANGTYPVAYRYIDSDGNYQPITGGSLTATIYAAQAPNPSILTDEQKPHAVADLTYDGQSHELVSAPTGTLPNNYEKVMYSTDGGTTWSDAIPAKTSADDYTVNYKYVDTDGAYADLIVPDSIPVSIAPAPAPDVDTLPDDQKPAAIDGLEYTGSAQDLIDRDTPATLPDGYDQIWYSTDGGSTWSQNIPTGTDAGEYEILYKYVDADGDHEDITGGSVTVSIAPADAPSADSLTDANKPSAVDELAYTGSAQNLVTPPSTLPEGYDQVWYSTDGGNTWSQTIPTGTDAGDYEVSVKYVDSNGNHDDLTGVTVPVTIAPAEAPDASSLTAAQKPTAVNGLAYTGSEQELVNAPSSLPAGYDEVLYSTDGGNTWSQDIPTGIEAGNYTVSVKYVDTDGNYEDLTGITVPVTIAQEAAPELTDAQKPSAVSGLTYTGSAQALVSAPASLPDGYEQVWYSLDGGNTWTQTIPTGTDAGTYTVSVRYVDTDGIKADILGSDITVTIAAGTTTAVINGVAQTVTIGSTLARPEDPTRYGYDFTGWFADEACTIPYNFNTPIGVNGVTLYAGWAQVSYSLTEGAGSTWSGTSTLTFRAVRNRLEPTTFSHFTGIQVDGKTVAPENYQAKSGSVIVILSESYLKTLSVGEHTLDIMFDDAPSVRSTFIIGEAQVASTGESMYSICTVLGALLIASAAGFVIFSLRHEEA